MVVWFYRLTRIAAVLALLVVVIGGLVRLTDAGLGCPDWPGCYGQLLAPQTADDHAAAQAVHPDRPVDSGAAWREMIHRYLAGTLGLLVLAIAAIAVRNRRDPRQPLVLPMLLLGLIVFQSLLGMWTVTLQLKPVVVMGHLLGGFATLTLLFALARGQKLQPRRLRLPLRAFGFFAALVLIGQIALGGWVSSNYAALACPDFPTCQTQWWPDDMDFREGFVLWRGIGVNYEFGVLDASANTAIHVAHRIGALTVLLVLGSWGLMILRRIRVPAVRGAAVLMLFALATQLGIGMSLIWWQLPLPLASAHNAVAALLLLAVVNLNLLLRREREEPNALQGRLR